MRLMASLLILGCLYIIQTLSLAQTIGFQASELLEPVDCAAFIPIPDIASQIFSEDNIRCAYILVPENHFDSASSTIKLATYVVPSSSPEPLPDPILFITGGPGNAGIASIPDFVTGQASFLREQRDVIIVDQRGTGYSQPSLYCPEMSLREDDALGAADCYMRLTSTGINLKHYNSLQNALDFQTIRKAYGYDQVNLYGVSYGTRLSLTIMREVPEGIRSVVLDSVFPPQVNGFSEDTESIYYVLDKIVAVCTANTACQKQYPDLGDKLEQGIFRLRQNPIGDLDAVSYLQKLRASFTEPNTPDFIYLVAEGSEDEIMTFLAAAADEEEFSLKDAQAAFPEDIFQQVLPLLISESQGMAYSVVCSEEYPFLATRARPESKNWPNLRDLVSQASDPGFNPEICTTWSVPKANHKELLAVSSPIPTLVLATDGDIYTPLSWSKLAAMTLSASQYVEFPSLSHGVLFDPAGHDCVRHVIEQFLAQASHPVDSNCIAGMSHIGYPVSE